MGLKKSLKSGAVRGCAHLKRFKELAYRKLLEAVT
jgi:hypothetical protein